MKAMMNARTVLIAMSTLLLGLMAAPAHAQSEALKSESDVQKFTASVMSAVGRGDLEAAYTALKKHSVLPPAEIDAGLQQTLAQRTNETFAMRYGKTVGDELISERKLGRSMLRYTYIERTERHPLPWVLNFYQSPKGWVLSEFGWDGNPAALYLTD